MNEPFVPIEELAKHFTVSVSTVRAWVRQGMIPKSTYIKAGNTYRFNVSQVVQALTQTDPPPREPNPEIDDPAPPAPEAPAADGEAPVQLELDFNNPDEDA